MLAFLMFLKGYVCCSRSFAHRPAPAKARSSFLRTRPLAVLRMLQQVREARLQQKNSYSFGGALCYLNTSYTHSTMVCSRLHVYSLVSTEARARVLRPTPVATAKIRTPATAVYLTLACMKKTWGYLYNHQGLHILQRTSP